MNSKQNYIEMMKQLNQAVDTDNTECTNKPCFDTDFCNPMPNKDTNGVLTMAFVNMQPLDTVYSTDLAFKNGTLFPNINKPFFGGNL